MLMLLALLISQVSSGELPPTCDSQVYCQGDLLHTVQMARIFEDSKTFVDLKMKQSENETLTNFRILMAQTNNNPTHEDIKQFVEENFEDGKELEEWTPPDFVSEPKFLNKIRDPVYKKFGKDIVELWKILARKMKPDVQENPELYSLMPLPNGFIIPGGRFKEIYYWDTYWIIRGLLISDMTETAKGMIENLMFLVKKLGHVPNGSRVYYTQRSQPPLLTRMVQNYMNYTHDIDWLRSNINILDKELNYWIKNRGIRLKKGGMTYVLYHYNAKSKGPRPESYREDIFTASSANDTQEMYNELKSGAESGWDYSSRWLFDAKGGPHANLSQIQTRRVIPVDLNSILYDAFSIMSQFYLKLGNLAKASLWKGHAKQLELSIMNVLWNETLGIWSDYDLKLCKHRPYFYPSNVMPLLTDCCRLQKTDRNIKKILAYLENNEIYKHPGGTPTSLIQSGEQWDFPNAWPPLQSIIVYGLLNTNNKEAKEMALKLAQNWVKANHIGFSETKEMFEKYDADKPGQYGGGGEYIVQAGFGWTNGVILELLDTYASDLTSNLS